MTEKPQMTIYEFYESILLSASHSVTPDGNVLLNMTKNTQPAMVDGKELILALPGLLREFDGEKQIFFHPLCESMTRYESEVFLYLKRAMTLRLITTFSNLGTGLIKLQEDPVAQRKMSLEQIELINNISSVDPKSAQTQIAAWFKLMYSEITASPQRMDKWPISIYLRRNGKFNNKNYRRVGVVTFPVMERVFAGEIWEKETPSGIKPTYRPKDYDAFKQVSQAIFPNIEKLGNEEYNSAYDGTTAPYFITFLRAFAKLADRMNFVYDMFAAEFSAIEFDTKTIKINLDWFDMITDERIEDLALIGSRIPALKGNVGTVNGEEAIAETKPKEPERRAAEPVRKAEPVKQATPEPAAPAVKSKAAVKEMTEGERQIYNQLQENRRRWQQEQDELLAEAKEREERELRRRGGGRDDRDSRGRDDHDYDRRDSRDDVRRNRDDRDRDDRRDRDEPHAAPTAGKVSISSLFNSNPSLVETSRSYEEEGRGRSRGRSYRDDYDDRDSRGRDDRDYDRRDSRYSDRGRDDRDYGRGRDDRDYDRRDDRGGWGRRDSRDDRDDRSRRSSWGRR